MEYLRDFLRNLMLIAGLLMMAGAALYLISPDIAQGMLQVYNGLGLTPFLVVILVLYALPRRRRRRRRDDWDDEEE